MVTLKDLESYIKVKEFMKDNCIEDINSIVEMTGAKLAPTISTSEDGESRKFYTLASGSKFMHVSMATMYYVHKNHRTRINRRVGGYKNLHIPWL